MKYPRLPTVSRKEALILDLLALVGGYADVGRSLHAGTEGVDFVLEPAATVTGQVVDEAGLSVTAYQLVASLTHPGRPRRDSRLPFARRSSILP